MPQLRVGYLDRALNGSSRDKHFRVPSEHTPRRSWLSARARTVTFCTGIKWTPSTVADRIGASARGHGGDSVLDSLHRDGLRQMPVERKAAPIRGHIRSAD